MRARRTRWQNSLSPSRLVHPVIQGNQLSGALLWGLRMSAGAAGVFVTGGVIRSNQVAAVGPSAFLSGGVLVLRACRNVLIGNDLARSASGTGVFFTSSSGANTFAGNETVVTHLGGVVDCTGDGVPDPNVINGRGAVIAGVHLGDAVSDGVVLSNGLLLQ